MIEARSLDRFVRAQAGIYQTALSEIEAGRKRSHWMWFVFPQIEGLGVSTNARTYAIETAAEARRYLEHELLGERLRESTHAMLRHAGSLRPVDILGPIDAMKFRSSMTLFEAAAEDPAPFTAALDKMCDGQRDDATLERL